MRKSLSKFAAVIICLLSISLVTKAYSAEKIDFSIPPQSLSSALLDFSYQSNVQLIIPGHIVEGFYVSGLNGRYAAEAALKILIKNTGLKYEFVSDYTVTIRVDSSDKKTLSAVRKRNKRSNYYGLEKILVTTDGREQEAQNLSASIIAISGEDLEKRGVSNADELQVFVPGLTIDSAQGGATDFTIRGIGASNDDLTTDPGVVVYIDDVYIPRQGPANLAVYDLDRVEVIRGPQGISSGRNTPGGAIRYVTRKPTPDFEARYLIDLGSLGRINNTLTVNGELSEKLYGQFVFASFRRDGIMENLAHPEREGNDIDNTSARFSLRSLPSENTELMFTADTQTVDQGDVLYSLGPNDGYQLDEVVPASLRSDPERSATTDFLGGEKSHISGLMARANIQAEAFRTSYIFGYREHDLRGHYDLDQRPEELLREGLDEKSRMKMLEIKLMSNQEGALTLHDRVSWIAGIFYLREKGHAKKTFDSTGLGYGVNQWQQMVVGRSAALYGQMTYAMSDKASVTTGLRFSFDTKAFELDALTDSPSGANPLLQETFGFEKERHWDNVSPLIALSYKASENTLFYGSFTRGYKPGGFEGTPISHLDAIQGQFDQEMSKNYEFGIKSKLFNNRMKFNLIGFAINYKDFQVSGFERLGNPIILNAPEVDIRGVELELEARPVLSLHVGLGVSFLDAEFRKFEVLDMGVLIDKRGDPVPDAPSSTVNLSAIYTFKETQRGVFSVRGDAIYSDKALDENKNISWPSYKIFNLWLDYTPHSGRWEMGFWVRNLTDVTYHRGSLSGVTADNSALARKLESPKQYGASLKYFW